MGVEPHGARPARGLIWPDHSDPSSPAAIMVKGQIIERDWPIRLEKSETPSFRAMHLQLWIPARVKGLLTRLADGSEIDQLQANRRGGPAFQPFGADEGQDSVLRMQLEATGYAPLFEPGHPKDAYLTIGVRIDPPTGAEKAAGKAECRRSPLEVTLVANGSRIALPVKDDSTEGMLRTGAIVLDVSAVEIAPMTATLEFRAPAGFERAPRILRIEPNVIPVIQRIDATTPYDGNGLPDQGFDLDKPGLEFEPGSDPVRIEVQLNGRSEKWTKTDRLDDCGPEDKKLTLDTVAAHVSFGNGINGAVPPVSSQVIASYSVTEGQAGNIAANRKWVVRGFSGLFGVNPDPTSGGEDPPGWMEQRREARRTLSRSHALVSPRDFEEAARDLTGLEVGRAWMMPPAEGDLATGSMHLVVMRARPGGDESAADPEGARWLTSVRQRLASRVPLGSRLRVTAPRYVSFSIVCEVEAESRQDPAQVLDLVKKELSRRLMLVSDRPRVPVRPFGLPVSKRDLVAWIQALPEVRRVRSLTIRVAGRDAKDRVDVPKGGLPRIDLEGSEINVVRSGGGA
jgi:predicted phage baseplate assembly protein